MSRARSVVEILFGMDDEEVFEADPPRILSANDTFIVPGIRRIPPRFRTSLITGPEDLDQERKKLKKAFLTV